MQLGQLGYYLGTVLGICYAEPLAGGGQYLAGGFASLYQVVYHEGDEELGLQVLLVLGVGEELLEVLFAILEVVGGEAPEVHAAGCIVGDGNPLVVLVEVLNHSVAALYLGALYYAGQEVCLLVVLADAAAYGSALAKGVAYAEAYHGILALAAFGKLGEELAHYHEGVAIVEVVAVQDGKGFLYHVLAHQYGMVGTPGLLAAFGNGEPFGQCIQTLEAEFAGYVSLVLRQYLCTELLFEILADYPYNLAESCLDSIVDAVIHDTLSLRT